MADSALTSPRRLDAAAPVTVGQGRLGVEDVVAVARCGTAVIIDPQAYARMAAGRAAVDRIAAGGTAVYGLNTGLGAAVDTRLSAEDIPAFQRRAIRARAVGVGAHLLVEEVRAALFVRLSGIAKGVSGLSPDFADAIAAMLNRGVHPLARRIGSLGEADLSPLASLFLPLAGGGEATFGGHIMPGPEALQAAGIKRPAFAPKDAISLLNANACSTGAAALAVHEIELVLESLTAAGVLSCEGFRANLSPIDPRVVALRSAPGQEEASAMMRQLLQGSDLLEAGKARRVQDPLSFRCLAPVHGAAFKRIVEAREAVEADLNGAGDSPAILADTGEMLSTVNFDTTAMALAFEALGLAASHTAALSVFRAAKLMSPAFSDLPRFLTRHGGTHTGFATVQKAASALEAEIRHLALPLGALTAPVADGVEDYAPMTPRVVEKTLQIGERLARLAAIELVVAAEAVDLREGIRLGHATAAVHRFVRERIEPLDDDRPMGLEFEALAEAILAGELGPALAKAAP